MPTLFNLFSSFKRPHYLILWTPHIPSLFSQALYDLIPHIYSSFSDFLHPNICNLQFCPILWSFLVTYLPLHRLHLEKSSYSASAPPDESTSHYRFMHANCRPLLHQSATFLLRWWWLDLQQITTFPIPSFSLIHHQSSVTLISKYNHHYILRVSTSNLLMIHLSNSFSFPGSLPFHSDHYCDNPHPDLWKFFNVTRNESLLQVGEEKGANLMQSQLQLLVSFLAHPYSTTLLFATSVIHYPPLLLFIICHSRYSLSTTHAIHYLPLLLFIVHHSCYSLSTTHIIHYPPLLSSIIRHSRYSLPTTPVIIHHSCYSLSVTPAIRLLCNLSIPFPCRLGSHTHDFCLGFMHPFLICVYVPAIFHLGLRTLYFSLGLHTHYFHLGLRTHYFSFGFTHPLFFLGGLRTCYFC